MALKLVREGRVRGEDGRPVRIQHCLDETPPKAFFLGRGASAEPSSDPELARAAFQALIPHRYRVH